MRFAERHNARRSSIGKEEISIERLQLRLSYTTKRFGAHAPYWQFVVWGRQFLQTLVTLLPDLFGSDELTTAVSSEALRGQSARAAGLIWVQVGLSLLIFAAFAFWHQRTQPFPFAYQNRLEGFLFFCSAALVVLCALYTIPDEPVLGLEVALTTTLCVSIGSVGVYLGYVTSQQRAHAHALRRRAAEELRRTSSWCRHSISSAEGGVDGSVDGGVHGRSSESIAPLARADALDLAAELEVYVRRLSREGRLVSSRRLRVASLEKEKGGGGLIDELGAIDLGLDEGSLMALAPPPPPPSEPPPRELVLRPGEHGYAQRREEKRRAEKSREGAPLGVAEKVLPGEHGAIEDELRALREDGEPGLAAADDRREHARAAAQASRQLELYAERMSRVRRASLARASNACARVASDATAYTSATAPPLGEQLDASAAGFDPGGGANMDSTEANTVKGKASTLYDERMSRVRCAAEAAQRRRAAAAAGSTRAKQSLEAAY